MPKSKQTPSGLEMYFEVTGVGAPLVVIPGGFMTIDQMRPFITSIERGRQVVAIEPQGHGRTADIDRLMSYEAMADDVATLIHEIGLERVDVCGFSVGAGIALQTAIRHPAAVRSLVFLSGVFKGDGEYAEVRQIASTFSPDNPMLNRVRDEYIRVAGSPAGWPRLVDKMRGLLSQSYDWSTQVVALRMPVLIVAGDSDIFPVAHALEMFRLLGGETATHAMGGPIRAQLAVLPATNHFSFMERVDLLAPIVAAFLEGSRSGSA